jgi:hypothetical protein
MNWEGCRRKRVVIYCIVMEVRKTPVGKLLLSLYYPNVFIFINGRKADNVGTDRLFQK